MRSNRERFLVERLLPGPEGAGNNHGFLSSALARLSGEWPRIRASVIVPVYNRRAILERTLAALCSQNYPRDLFEVIVADDGSNDRPEELLATYSDGLDLRFVRQEDRGFRVAAVRNLAIGASTGDVIVGLDCDMLPMRGWLRAMLAPFHVYNGPLCIIGRRRNVDTSSLDAATIRQDVDAVARLRRVPAPAAVRIWWAPSLDWRVPIYWRTRMLRTHAAPFTLAAGGNLAYRKVDAIAAGLHDESFSHWGGEDDEFAYRLYRQGAYFIPQRRAVAYHQAHEVQTPREEHRQKTRQLLGRKVPQYRRYSPDGSWETPRVSVCIRALNAERTVAGAIDSALAQTLTDLEVCVYDAGSTDGTQAVIARYADRPRVRILPSLPSRVSQAWNLAAGACKGEMILPMSANETLMPEAVAKLAEALDSASEVAIAYGGSETIDAAGQVSSREVPGRYSLYAHLHRNVVSVPRMIRARDLWRANGWDESLQGAEDYDLLLRIGERGTVQPVAEVLGLIHADGSAHASADRERHEQWTVQVVRRALTRRGIPADVEGYGAAHPDTLAIVFNEKALARQRRRRGFFTRPQLPEPHA